ncbi:MAG TPA: RluA family pseudouridine synthase [Kofleriaceae bacterium]|jgi:23S rRNA pseudouridine1911/1915/1917 synthase|nr:RluA family pseudouridine synthase [Kofleriaceae bacterium]
MKLTIDVADRVDKALARFFPDAGRRQLAGLFDAGAVRVNGKRARKGDRVSVGDTVELAREPVSGDALRPAPDPDVPLTVIVERTELVVVAKPAGIPSQPLRAGELGTIANAIAFRYPECVAIGDDPRDGGLVHRLDIGTSGALVVARTMDTYRALRDAFGAGLVSKHYLAITDGQPVARECDQPLAQRGKRVAIDLAEGLAAYTEIAIERSSPDHAFVRCIAQTGRMHQVRAHLAHVGAPITGDTLYGGAPLHGHDGFFLHAVSITFPLGRERFTAEAPLPPRFTSALTACALD